MKKLLLASTSTIYGSGYLEYLLKDVAAFFEGVTEVLFIPYARPSGITHKAYTEIAAKAFATINISIKGLHEFENPKEAIVNAQGIFTGGGNTFLLVKQLYENDLMQLLQTQINKGTPYMGTSAGSNIAGKTVRTTNDMPIVYPPSFDALSLVDFNINPHYLDADPNSKHKGETRETRILEYLTYNTIPVVGLREGSWLLVSGERIVLKGKLKARVFITKDTIQEVASETDLAEIL